MLESHPVTTAQLVNNAMQKMENSLQKVGNYLLGQTIGKGAFGKVQLGVHMITGEKVAVKVLDKEKIVSEVDRKRVNQEIAIMRSVKHSSIIELFEVIETTYNYFLVMEYAEKGELFDYILEQKEIPEKEACRLFQQMLRGIEYLHHMHITHRDIKPENLLLDKHLNVKIVDFGLSASYEPGKLLKTPCGSPCYASPEMIEGHDYDGSQVDIWSMGIVLYTMMCGRLPFQDQNTAELFRKIASGEYFVPEFLSDNAKNFVGGLLKVNREERFNISQIKAHPWYHLHAERAQLIKKSRGEKIDLDIVAKIGELGYEVQDIIHSVGSNLHDSLAATLPLGDSVDLL